MIRGTDFIVYEVSDFDRAVNFYTEILGLKLTKKIDSFGWAEFDVYPTTLALGSTEHEARLPSTGGASIALAVAGLSAFVDTLKNKKVRILREVGETPVCCMAMIEDPDGNRIILHERKDGTFG